MKDCILPVKNDLKFSLAARPNGGPPVDLKAPFEPRPFDRNGFEALVSSLSADALARYEGFCLSPAYYELTGRRGLWMTSDGRRTVVYCRHSNVEHEYLVFPELGEAVNYDLTLRLVESLHADRHAANRAVRLARFTAGQATAILGRANGGRLAINEIDEDVLDWRYAIRILSSKLLTSRGAR